MGKKIIITSGPTNERIDSVMKITNMSTGALGCAVANTLLSGGTWSEIDTIYYLSPKLAYKPDGRDGNNPDQIPVNWGKKLVLINIESAEDLLAELKRLLTTEHIDAVVHSAAVGDYKAKYSVRGEDLASEIASLVLKLQNESGGMLDRESIYNAALYVLDNPNCATDDSGKMSSYEPRLMTMLTLTPKVIGCVKETSPDTLLIGFKLLDSVTNDELFQVADKLRARNNADYIVANDLSRIGNGKHWAMIVSANGVVKECQTKAEIAETISGLIFPPTTD